MRLLIVDDSRMSRLILLGLVRQLHPDWDTLQASSGEEAIAALQQHQVDLVSLDYNMPGLNGIQVTRQIQALRPGLPVVLMTANVQSAVRQQAESHGLLFLPKPITADSVQQMHEWWQRQSHAGGAS